MSPGKEDWEILQRHGHLLGSGFVHMSGIDASPAPRFLALEFFSARGTLEERSMPAIQISELS